MPPFTKLPRPAGHLYFQYSPMSPPNWGMVPARIQVFVYPDIRVALKALIQASTTIHAQGVEKGLPTLLSDYLLFRGQSHVAHRLLPTRVRCPSPQVPARKRFNVASPPTVTFNGVEFPSVVHSGGEGDVRDNVGDWYEEVEPMRVIEDCLAELDDVELALRDQIEQTAIARAESVPELASLDGYRKRAAVRHYAHAPSPLLDLSTNPEVAAFFATVGASAAPPSGGMGMLWAIDLNFLGRFFFVKKVSVPGGEKIILKENREGWGDNARMFEEYGVLPAQLEICSVQLPFARPQAQHARFLSLTGENNQPLPAKTELTWWSIIERSSYQVAFLHGGRRYENPDLNISRESLYPAHEPLAIALST